MALHRNSVNLNIIFVKIFNLWSIEQEILLMEKGGLARLFFPNLSIIDVMMFNSKEKIKDMLREFTLV